MTLLKTGISVDHDISSAPQQAAVNQDFTSGDPNSPASSCPIPSFPNLPNLQNEIGSPDNSSQPSAPAPKLLKATITKTGGKPAAKKPPAITPGGALTPAVIKQINQSPMLTGQIIQLQRNGWSFVPGTPGKGTFADRSTRTITLDPNLSATPADNLTSLSHEVGHARRRNPSAGPMKGKTAKQYIDGGIHQNLLDEADATINNIRVRQDLINHGGPTIGIAGAHGNDYLKFYNTNRKTARENTANMFGSGEHPSNQPGSTYAQYYRPYWQQKWNAAHPKKAGGGHH